MIHDFLSFYIVVGKCEAWKGEAFLWSAPELREAFKHFYGRPQANVRSGKGKNFYVAQGDINIAKPLLLSMLWDITSLVQSVNLICAKRIKKLLKAYVCFSLRQQQNHEQHFKNLFWTE